jgi:cysteine synthase
LKKYIQAMQSTVTNALQAQFNNLWHMVGNTPMIAIHYTYKGEPRTLYAKCEHYNLTGSIKDRMALYIMEQAYTQGTLQPHNTIIEATSGNTGIAFAAIGKALGHKVIIIMPNWLSKERIDIIKSLGAEIILVSKEEGGYLRCIALSQEMKAADSNVFLPQQFENEHNCQAHYTTTAPEIWTQLQSINKAPDAFVAGVGTGGTVMGIGNYLRTKHPAIKIHPLEPLESPTFSTGYKVGAHRIQGISDEFIPNIVKLNELDTILQASDSDAILVAQQLASQLGVAVGISAGANIVGAIKLQNKLGANSTVVTILCDSNKKYLSTDLMKTIPLDDSYVATHTVFTGYTPIKRAF